MSSNYFDLFMMDIRRRLFEENQVRIHTCLDIITEDQLWHKPNGNTNSIGNLILHLCGNIQQYVLSGILKEKDNRLRDAEFESAETHSISEIGKHLDESLEKIAEALDKVTLKHLEEKCNVQGFEENGTSILIHVVEHFSYHVGQITLLTKMYNDVDTRYYGDLDLNAKS